MAHMHHGSIRKYTAALLEAFNSIEIQYKMSNGDAVLREVPLKYSSQEKSKILDEYTAEQLHSGNYNVLPRASLALVSMNKAENRVTNKNNKIGSFKTDDSLEFMFNSVPYEFTYELIVQCRGMNEATQIIEQIAPKFNPIVNIDVWDANNLDEPTRIPVRLTDISMESDAYDELSINLTTVTFSISLMGNLYPPIKSMPRIQEFKMYFDRITSDSERVRSEMLEWDTDLDGKITG